MTDEFERLSEVQPLMKSLYKYAKENLAFKPDATIAILKDNVNADNPLGKTAYYDPANHKISLYTQGRHVKDVMRSLSHEIVHHAQNCRGMFDSGVAAVSGYAQEDGHLREMEREAYETGNLIFRDWEDGLKTKTNNSALFSNTKSLGEKLMENKMNEAVDKVLVDEIVLVMTNDGDFYQRTIQPWIKNFQRKIKRGVFNKVEALKAFERYVAKAALKKYSIDQAGDPNYWKQIGKEDRQAIAADLLDSYMEEIEYVNEQKTMENQETELREVIRGLVKEMLISVKETVDSAKDVEDEETGRAAEEGAEAASAAALGGVTTSNQGESEKDEPFEIHESKSHAHDCKSAFGEHSVNASKAKMEDCLDDPNYLKASRKDESLFFPTEHNILDVARMRTNDALMKRWGYNKK